MGMSFLIPKDIKYYTGDYMSSVGIKISPIKDGYLLYNNQGDLIGQVFKPRKDPITFSLADSWTYEFTGSGNNIKISPKVSDDVENKEIKNPSARKRVQPAYEIFGNVMNLHYDMYELKPGDKKPRMLYQVIAHPLKDEYVGIKVEDYANPIIAIGFTLAISLV